MKLRTLAVVGLVIVGVGAAGVSVIGLPSGSSTEVTYRTSEAAVTTVEETAVASGSLAAASTYDLAFGETPTATSDTTTSTSSSTSTSTTAAASSTSTGTGTTAYTVTWPVTTVNVAVGDVVKAGDVLAIADDSSAQLAVRLAEANLAAARAQLRTDKAGGTATSRAAARDSVTQATLQLSQARASYSNTVAQNALSLKRARQAVTDAKAQYKADKAAGANAQVLAQDKAAITSAEQSLESTRLQVANGNRQASAQVTSANQSLKTARRNYRSATSSADDATLMADEIAIAEARTALAAAQEALDNATLVAPVDGTVTAVSIAAGEDAPSGTAIELQSTQMSVTASFGEDDIVNLKVGQAATIAISATGTTATGTVTEVSPVAATSGSSSVVTYSVTVTLDDSGTGTTSGSASGTGGTSGGMTAPGSGSDASPTSTSSDAATTAATASPSPDATTSATPLSGMTADVTIVIAEADDAVAIPAIALTGSSGSYTVRVLATDGTLETRSVEVGLITSDLAQITSGISAGDTVVTGTSADRTTTSSSSSTANGGGDFGGLSGAGGFQGGPPAGGPPGQDGS